jgi:hypothetical protein
MMDYKFHTDAGHGWLEVSREELELLGIEHEISRYSYQAGGIVYLEEDCDANTFINAMDAKGVKPRIHYLTQEETSFIRSLERYSGF